MSKYQCTDIKKIIYCPFECNSLFWTPWFKRFFKVDGMEIMDKFSLQNMICMRIFLEEKSKENLQVELPEIHTLLSLQRSFEKRVIQLFSWIWKKIPKGKRKIHSVKSLFLITKKWKEEGRKTWKTGFNFFCKTFLFLLFEFQFHSIFRPRTINDKFSKNSIIPNTF